MCNWITKTIVLNAERLVADVALQLRWAPIIAGLSRVHGPGRVPAHKSAVDCHECMPLRLAGYK